METKHLKTYAPKARREFIDAIQTRAGYFGIYADRVAEMRSEGGISIIEGNALSRKQGEQRKHLVNRLENVGYEMFIREIAYTWFNRLVAIRYMELHDYLGHGFRVLSHPTDNDGLPEIIQHASDVATDLGLDKSAILEMQLAGNKEEALYRELLLGQCHYLHRIMPFMFEAIDDATELLLPDNLTKTDSILKGLFNDIPEDNWQEIEVIGWLYQFYISEHKDAVIGKVVKSEDIPAATQLFTPNWIVKYLVQNSVGRQWLATYPDSELKGKMEYYIEPAEQSDEVIEQLKAITPSSIDPEEIKVLDPAMGSGHILVEVYNVLKEIYLERGYRQREIPELILTKNIYGLDIDDRAAQLAGFALMMKAREDDRRIFQRVEDGEVSLNVLSLQSTEHLDIPRLWKVLDLEGKQQTGTTGGLFDITEEFIQPTGIYKEYFELLQTLKMAFLQAKTFGSLIQVDAKHLDNLLSLKQLLLEKLANSDTQSKPEVEKILPIVDQAIVLAKKYDSVCANPPYIGNKFQSPELKDFLKSNYLGVEKDIFSVFMIRNISMTKEFGQLGFMTPFVWMFISSYEKLRERLLKTVTISTLIQLEYSAFEGATVPICTFTFSKKHIEKYVSTFIKLSDFKGASNQAPKVLEAIGDDSCTWKYEINMESFKYIPNYTLSYWAKPEIVAFFKKNINNGLGQSWFSEGPCKSGKDDTYLRYLWEVDYSDIAIDGKWRVCAKGGNFRKYFGNEEYLLRWSEADQQHYRNDKIARITKKESQDRIGVTWSLIGSGYGKSFRLLNDYSLFNSVSPCIFSHGNRENEFNLLAYLNSNLAQHIFNMLNPTLALTVSDIMAMPDVEIGASAERLYYIARDDWYEMENSLYFKNVPIINNTSHKTIRECFNCYLERSEALVQEYQELEEEINIIINSALDLENTVENDVPIDTISLNCNKKFIFKEKAESEQDEQFQTSIVSKIISYSLGCMMGRYSLDREGLVYAQSGNEGFKELEIEGAYRTFPADDDGIIPLASEDWLFDDDATTRFKEFVKTVWGDEHLSDNLDFVAESLCLHAIKPKKGEGAMDTIRRYFSTQFFKDHCKTYKKRPIYWLFSSGKEKAFECLVYLHRYNEGTLSRMRTEYVTPLMGKYDAQHVLLSDQMLTASTADARRLDKEVKGIEKKMAELRKFDEQLKHYAEMRISLDLDDGVKVNYGKFGNLLADVKAIHGKVVS